MDASAPAGIRPSTRPSDSELLNQLQRMLGSPVFAPSGRLCRFLRWTVEHALAGETEALKEYSLGRDVFDRGESYDPKIDSIVRVEAQRLRKKLRSYYAGEGRNDPVRIEFPKKGYVPDFRRPEASPADEAARLDPLTVAVLPFRNLSPEADQDLLCEGIAEEILGELSSGTGLNVLAGTSTFAFGETNMDIPEIGLRLGAGTVLDGSVRKAGRRVRISVRACDTRSGKYIWTHRFDRDLLDILNLQIEIAQAVALNLGVVTLPAARAAGPAPNPEAYMLYLRGRREWNRSTISSCRDAVADYEKAILLSPEYAQPSGALAIAHLVLMWLGAAIPAEAALLSRRAALRALRLDPQCVDAYIALGTLAGCLDWDWSEGERLLQRALSLRGSDIVGLAHQAIHYANRGKIDTCLAIVDRMLALDPLTRQAQTGAALFHYMARNDVEAARWMENARIVSKAPYIYSYLGRTLFSLGRGEEAIQRLEEAQRNGPDPLLMGALAEVVALCGGVERAYEILGRLRSFESGVPVSPMAFVYAYVGLGDWTQALGWLEKATEEGWASFSFLILDRRYDPVRSEPRFRRLLERMNLS